jgi:aminoglycoside phosphotransferase family enzyme
MDGPANPERSPSANASIPEHMNSSQVLDIIQQKALPHPSDELRLIETHISWVLLGDAHVYKIKKPLNLSFLDFSDLEKRRVNCHREVLLNRRLASDMYLGVLPVRLTDHGCQIGEGDGEIIDYAVHMQRMDETRQLDVLLESGEVSAPSIAELARILSNFHKSAPIISQAEDWEEIFEEFRDLQSVTKTLSDVLGKADGDRMRMVIGNCWKFLRSHGKRIDRRKAMGFVKDGHGDLHCRNILLTRPPVVFDCIEFSEELRTLDVLSEIGFLCMDLERYGRSDLSDVFRQTYEREYPCMEDAADRRLFTFYKMYRANVRMKVDTLALEQDASASFEADAPFVYRLKGYSNVFFMYARELGLLKG